jgi:hypothetical protein
MLWRRRAVAGEPRLEVGKANVITQEQSRGCDPNMSGRYGQAPDRVPRSRPRHVQSRNRQQARGCDVVAMWVEDVAGGGYTADRATVRQKN